MNRYHLLFRVLPFLFLLVWFWFESSFHLHPVLVAVWLFFSYTILLMYIRMPAGGFRRLFLIFWVIISSLVLVDFLQLIRYGKSSDAEVLYKIEENDKEIQRRATALLETCRSHSREIEEILNRVHSLSTADSFIRLQETLEKKSYWWGVYAQDGQLVSWSGQVPYREGFLAAGVEEISVVSELHQQFLKHRRSVKAQDTAYSITVLNPVAADYGIRNRYLNGYNLFTDGLSIRPDLLYNSQQSTTTSPDLIIRTLAIAPEFSISVLYKKVQYSEFLVHRIFQLHWWLELVALAFILTMNIFLFFDFVGRCGEDVSSGETILSWFVLLVVSGLSCFIAAHFSSTGFTAFFRLPGIDPAGNHHLFRSPGGFLLTSFLILNVVMGLALLVRRVRFATPSGRTAYLFLAGCFLLSGVLFAGYYDLVRSGVSFTAFDPIGFSAEQFDMFHFSQVFGMLWLDLSVAIIIGILYSLAMPNIPRNQSHFAILSGVQLAVFAILYLIFRRLVAFPYVPFLILYVGMCALVFFLPVGWQRFRRVNLVSRFLVSLVLVSLVSALFHFARFHYAADVQKSFVEKEAASQVNKLNSTLADVLRASQRQLDEIVRNISVDPKIPDLAYRLWSRTDLARRGYKSAVEVYGQNGAILNRFAISLPRLSFDFAGNGSGETWNTFRRVAVFGNSRRLVSIAIRTLPGVGYLVVEVAQDYENLPFVPPSSPFQELFRPPHDYRFYTTPPLLNVYDPAWRPLYVASPDMPVSVQNGANTLRNKDFGWIVESPNGRPFHVYYFKTTDGYASLLIPAVTLRGHLVHLIDLLLFNLLWLSLFALALGLFFHRRLTAYFSSDASTRFNFFQKLLVAFVIFSMVPMLFLSLFIRNYVEKKKVDEVTSRSLHSFSVATKVVGDYLLYRTEAQGPGGTKGLFTDDLLEWISQVIQQDISFYYDRYLLAASNRELFSAGLLGEQISGKTYMDLFYKGQKYSISDGRIGTLEFLNVSGRIYTGRYKDEVVTIPFLINRKSVEAKVGELREYMMLVGAGLILFAVFLGYFLASRFARPVRVLIEGTGEMSRGNLEYRIRESYQDEFRQLVESFNAMAGSLHEQQETLERRRAYIENILNHITTAVISIDSTTIVATVNPAAVRMFGIDASFRGPVDCLLPAGSVWSEVQDALCGFLTKRSEFQIKEIGLFHTNRETNLRLIYVPLFEESKWKGAVLLVEDISDIIRSNRLSAYAEMARRIAHEVKNPLTPIQLAMEHLLRVYQDKSESFGEVLQSCVDAVLKQVKALRMLVSDFSQYGRPGALNRTEIDLNAFLTDIADGYRGHLPEGIGMDVRLDEKLPAVRMDADKIRGALMNIIENGLQAMNGHGRITLEVANGKDGRVQIGIHDTGQGVPPEVLPRMFEPYFSTKSGGTGLGLPIARKNVEDQGGSIQVESQEGKGTTVTIVLPIL